MSAPRPTRVPLAVETRALFTVRSRLDRVVRALAFVTGWGPMALAVTSYELGLRDTAFERLVVRPLFPGFLLVCLAFTLLALSLPGLRRRSPATLEVVEDALRIRAGQSERVVPRGDVLSGLVTPGIEGMDVELRLRDGSVLRAEKVPRAGAERVLEALDVGARGRRAVISLGAAHGPIVAAPLATVGWIFAMSLMVNLPFTKTTGFGAASVLLGALVSWLAARWARPSEVVVGTDGVLVRKGLRERFVLFRRITNIRVDKAVKLELDDGATLALGGGSPQDRSGLAARLGAARAAHAEVSAAADTRLARGGRSVRAWREALAGAAQAVGSYRAAALAPESLEAVMANPSAPVERRIGAALALAGSGVEGAKEKIRIAADACADEKVRVAITEAAAAEPDEAVIEAALAEHAEDRAIQR